MRVAVRIRDEADRIQPGHRARSLSDIAVEPRSERRQNPRAQRRSLRRQSAEERRPGHIGDDLAPARTLCTAAHRHIGLHLPAQRGLNTLGVEPLFIGDALQYSAIEMLRGVVPTPAHGDAAGPGVPIGIHRAIPIRHDHQPLCPERNSVQGSVIVIKGCRAYLGAVAAEQLIEKPIYGVRPTQKHGLQAVSARDPSGHRAESPVHDVILGDGA